MFMATKSKEIILNGDPISPGIAIGKVFILDDDYIETKQRKIQESDIQKEIDKLKLAIHDTILDFHLIIDQVGTRISAYKREIFKTILLILEDPNIIENSIAEIKRKKINADYAYYSVMINYQRSLDASSSRYFQERSLDVRDVKRRVINKILGLQKERSDDLSGMLVVTNELNIFDAIALSHANVEGIIQEGGGKTTHTTIMIRALELPGIISVPYILQKVKNNDIITVNGLTGEVILNPKQATLKQYIRKSNTFKKFEHRYLSLSSLPSVTRDNVPFTVNANIELDDEVDSVVAHGGFGIGLFRTEYVFMADDRLPTEEEQYEKYSNVIKKINPHPVTIRTLDLGGDKVVPFLDTELEHNPFLGWRAIRICLDMPDILRKQLRAIYRASVWGKVKLLFPLITSLEEIHKIKYRMEEVKTALTDQRIDFDENIPVGIMIEVPSAVMLADQFAKKVDYFSIGTNDLIQFTLAVDRGNARVANLYNSFHPAVLRMIKTTVQACNKNSIPVGLCGEMAGDPFATILLFGLGITEFSASPIMLSKIKQILKSIKLKDAKKVSNRCLRFQTTKEVETYMQDVMRDIFPRMDEDDFFQTKS